MKHKTDLDALNSGFCYGWRGDRLILLQPGAHGQLVLTDDEIDRWLDAEVTAGRGTRDELDAALKARRDDIASGHEDRVWEFFSALKMPERKLCGDE